MPATYTELPDGTYSVLPPKGKGKPQWVFSKDDAEKLKAAMDANHAIDEETAKIIELLDDLLVWLPKIGRCVMAKSKAHAEALLAEGSAFTDDPADFDPDDYFVEDDVPEPDNTPRPY